MPTDKLHVRVETYSGKTAGYSLAHVTYEGETHEVWGYAPLCYRQVKLRAIALISRR